jgi:aryl-alcohol dehydrogenase-like predicted oxidoreductase
MTRNASVDPQAAPTVERATLAPGYEISRIIKGGWQLSKGHGQVDYDRAIDDMARFVEAGITVFDCADIYTGVEDLIGAFRRKYPALAQRVRVHTKLVPDDDVLETLTRQNIEAIIDRSRRRLNMECLDLVQFSWWRYDADRYVEVMGWLDDFRKAGKIRLLGVTNFNSTALGEILDAGIPVATNQMQYSLIDDRARPHMVDLCARHGVALLNYGTLAGGFISKRWLGVPEPTGGFDNRSLVKYKLVIDDFGGWDLFQELLSTLDAIAQRHGTSIAAVATRAMLDRPQVAACIIGAHNANHLPDNLRVFAFALDEADHARIDQIVGRRQGPAGDVFDLERNRSGKHGAIMKYNLHKEEA